MTSAAIANHLWQSTLCVAGAALLVHFLKNQAARWRYRVWLAASLKFFVPFALLASVGNRIPTPALPTAPGPSGVSVVMEFLGQPFSSGVSTEITNFRLPITDSAIANSRLPVTDSSPSIAPVVLLSLWFGGCLALVVGKAVRWRQLRVMLRTARSLTRGREADALERAQARIISGKTIEVCALSSPVEPGVVGIAHPIILWPMDLSKRLNDHELDAIFAHELQHVLRRDNLTAALHGVLEIALWFHPAIWWLKSRLIAERERACDEAVLQLGSEPQTYARGILKVCEFCLQTPAIAGAAVTGADLSRRMEDIMSERTKSSLKLRHRLLLGVSAAAVVIGPILVGSLHASPLVTPFTPQPGTWRAAAIAAVAPFEVTPAPAEPQTGSGVTGTITDLRGAAVADAIVHASPEAGGTGYKATTNANGMYALDLPPGQYELSVVKPGFQMSKTTAFLARGISLQRDFRLNLGTVQESINVNPNAPRPTPEAALAAVDRARALIAQGSLADAEGALVSALSTVRQVRGATGPTAATRVPSGSQVRVGGEVRPPRKIKDVAPVYPPVARAANISGIVIIDSLIGTDGKVKEATILRGQQLLNQAALDAVSQWEFEPVLLNGVPVEVFMSVTVNFQPPPPPAPATPQ